MSLTRYDYIGKSYARTRREDPRFADRIHAALGDARTVLNVGAGTGSYEPHDRQVVAVEPSAIMIAQRRRILAPAIQARAQDLPLRDDSVDAAMALLTIHHWDNGREQGVRELRRVSRGPVVILTYDAEISSRMWLMAEYLPEVAELDRRIFPSLSQLEKLLGGHIRTETILIPRDTPDWMLGSFWAHPERVLDIEARNGTSGFARMQPEVIRRVIAAVDRDLASGLWERRHGYLRALDAFDAGLRLVVGTL